MLMDGVVFLAARTARSQAYSQALVRAGLAPARTLLLDPGTPDVMPPRAPAAPCRVAGLNVPDLGQPLATTVVQAGWTHETLPSADVNDGQALAALQRLQPRLLVYSGYGGQLVGDALLALGIPFLHLHSGWLPDFRGSTTLYYSLLSGQRPAVSALVLDRGIDAGRILLRRRYPIPPRDCELDLLYDNAIRADLLVRVLRRYLRRNGLWQGRAQGTDAGRNYYVIHPVLKHLARLSLHADVQA